MSPTSYLAAPPRINESRGFLSSADAGTYGRSRVVSSWDVGRVGGVDLAVEKPLFSGPMIRQLAGVDRLLLSFEFLVRRNGA